MLIRAEEVLLPFERELAAGEREQLCEYVEDSLIGNGIDVEVFAGRHGLPPGDH